MTTKQLIRRLRICFRWQWRQILILDDTQVFLDCIVMIIRGILTFVLWPFILLWQYTGDIIWIALTAEDSGIDDLEQAMPKKLEKD